MERIILYKRDAGITRDERELITSLPDIKIVNQGFNRLLLVEANFEIISSLKKSLPGWTIQPEVYYERPERGMRCP